MTIHQHDTLKRTVADLEVAYEALLMCNFPTLELEYRAPVSGILNL
jgi:hypothetical protein